jgi:hypothetical protein
MEMEALRAPQSEALLDTGEASPLPERPSQRHASLRVEARRRRVMANLFLVCSSVVAVAVLAICYALLAQ